MKKIIVILAGVLFLLPSAQSMASEINSVRGFGGNEINSVRGMSNIMPVNRYYKSKSGAIVSQRISYNRPNSYRGYYAGRPRGPIVYGMQPVHRYPAHPRRVYGYTNGYANGYRDGFNSSAANAVPTLVEAKPVSRLSKDYTRPPKSSYKRNGVTYYN